MGGTLAPCLVPPSKLPTLPHPAPRMVEQSAPTSVEQLPTCHKIIFNKIIINNKIITRRKNYLPHNN